MLVLDELDDCLARLRCPAFLRIKDANANPKQHQQQSQCVASSAFRKTFVLWLFAVYRAPALCLSSDNDESWIRHEPLQQELLQWLHLVVRVRCA